MHPLILLLLSQSEVLRIPRPELRPHPEDLPASDQLSQPRVDTLAPHRAGPLTNGEGAGAERVVVQSTVDVAHLPTPPPLPTLASTMQPAQREGVQRYHAPDAQSPGDRCGEVPSRGDSEEGEHPEEEEWSGHQPQEDEQAELDDRTEDVSRSLEEWLVESIRESDHGVLQVDAELAVVCGLGAAVRVGVHAVLVGGAAEVAVLGATTTAGHLNTEANGHEMRQDSS